jgi:flagellar protein FlaH
MSQMVSLDLDVTDYFLCDRLRVYPIRPSNDVDNLQALNSLLEHFESLPVDIRLIIVDALTGLMPQGDERQTVDFFAGCKQLCDLGRTVILVMESDGDSDALLERARAICDTHLVLRIEQQDEHQVRVLEVAKLNNSVLTEGNLVQFSVEPGFGLNVLSPTRGRR